MVLAFLYIIIAVRYVFYDRLKTGKRLKPGGGGRGAHRKEKIPLHVTQRDMGIYSPVAQLVRALH